MEQALLKQYGSNRQVAIALCITYRRYCQIRLTRKITEQMHKFMTYLLIVDSVVSKSKGWQPIGTAPKGGGAELTSDPDWVEPPEILLLFQSGEIRVGNYDWYYSETGFGYEEGVSAWVDATNGERLALYYDEPIMWMSLSELPQPENGYRPCTK